MLWTGPISHCKRSMVWMDWFISAPPPSSTQVPRQAPLWLPIALIVAAAGILLVNVVLLSRVRAFAWHTFFVVGRYALLAYLVIAGMLEFVFVYDKTPGTLLVLLSIMLAIYAVDIPLLFAFSVARYQPPDA